MGEQSPTPSTRHQEASRHQLNTSPNGPKVQASFDFVDLDEMEDDAMTNNTRKDKPPMEERQRMKDETMQNKTPRAPKPPSLQIRKEKGGKLCVQSKALTCKQNKI
jgi:hypothetical protein